MFDPRQGWEAAARRLGDPRLDPSDLAAIAVAFPALAPQVAAHPRVSPELATWLASFGNPEVDAVLAARFATFGVVPSPAPLSEPPAEPSPGHLLGLPRALSLEPLPGPPPGHLPASSLAPLHASPPGPLPGPPLASASGPLPAPSPGPPPELARMDWAWRPAQADPRFGPGAEAAASYVVATGPTFGDGAGRVGGAPRKAKRWPLAVGASGIVAVVVVALLVVASQRAETGGQVWGGGPSGGAAPASHPSGDQFWGAPIDPAELLEGDFNGFGFVFEQTRDPNWPQDDSQPDLALLDDHTALMYASAESPSLSGGTVVLAAVDLPSGEVRWQADVGDALEGFYYGGAIVRDACGTGEGGALVNLASMGADIETVMVRLEPDGQVASVMENVVCEEIVDGKAVFGGEVDWDGAHEVLVSGLDRLKDPLWRAVASEAWLSPLVLESEAGDFVLTADGYVDAATGRPAAFGGDADARWPDTFYAMTESGVVLRGHVEQGLAEVAALDPATGDELWRTDVAEDDSIAEGAATGEEEEYDDRPLYDLYLSLEYGGGRVFLPGENGCRVLDEVTGEEVFVTDAGDFFGVTGRTLVVATYDEEETFVGLSLDDGHQLFAVRPCGPAELEDFGRLGLGVLYAVCWDADTESVALAGFDLEGGAELWSVPFPDEFWVETSIDDPFLVFGAGQAFLWSVFSGPERPGIEEWECLFPLEAH